MGSLTVGGVTTLAEVYALDERRAAKLGLLAEDAQRVGAMRALTQEAITMTAVRTWRGRAPPSATAPGVMGHRGGWRGARAECRRRVLEGDGRGERPVCHSLRHRQRAA